MTQSHDDWLVNSDGPQFFRRAKKSGNTPRVSSQRDQFIFGNLTSLQAWIPSRCVTKIRDCFIGWLRKWFISNQSKMVYYCGGSFLVWMVVNMSEEVGVWPLYEALGHLNSSEYTITDTRIVCVVIMKSVLSNFKNCSLSFLIHSYNFHMLWVLNDLPNILILVLHYYIYLSKFTCRLDKNRIPLYILIMYVVVTQLNSLQVKIKFLNLLTRRQRRLRIKLGWNYFYLNLIFYYSMYNTLYFTLHASFIHTVGRWDKANLTNCHLVVLSFTFIFR